MKFALRPPERREWFGAHQFPVTRSSSQLAPGLRAASGFAGKGVMTGEHRDEFIRQRDASPFETVDNFVAQSGIQVIVAHRLVEVPEYVLIDQFGLRTSADDWCVYGAVCETSSQCAVHVVQRRRFVLNVGLKMTVAKDQFAAQLSGRHQIDLAAIEKGAGDTSGNMQHDVPAIGEIE